MDETTLKFWNECHETKNISGLSATSYDLTIELLKLKDYIKPNIKVLEIGVGVGYVIKEFYDMGISISGLDVSNIALENVKQYCEKTFTVDDLEKIPSNYYDIIICLNVVQHVVTSLLIEELKYLIRSLKDDGILSIEFVSTETIEDGGMDKTSNSGESFFRSKKYLKKMIDDLGGKCELVYDSVRFYDKNWQKDNMYELSGNWVVVPLPVDDMVIGCHVFHVRKK